ASLVDDRVRIENGIRPDSGVLAYNRKGPNGRICPQRCSGRNRSSRMNAARWFRWLIEERESSSEIQVGVRRNQRGGRCSAHGFRGDDRSGAAEPRFWRILRVRQEGDLARGGVFNRGNPSNIHLRIPCEPALQQFRKLAKKK